MSLVSKGVFLNVTLADAAGNKSNLQLATKYTDLADLSTNIADITGAGGVLADLNAITDATIVSYSIGEAFAEDATFYGAAGSEVEANALIVAKVDGSVPGKTVSLRVPAPVDGMFLGTTGDNRNIVDTADADTRAWLANFTSTGVLTVSDGESIEDPTAAGTWKGKRIHRGSRNG